MMIVWIIAICCWNKWNSTRIELKNDFVTWLSYDIHHLPTTSMYGILDLTYHERNWLLSMCKLTHMMKVWMIATCCWNKWNSTRIELKNDFVTWLSHDIYHLPTIPMHGILDLTYHESNWLLLSCKVTHLMSVTLCN